MPKPGLKQKSKRTTAKSSFDNAPMPSRPADNDVEMDDETSSDEESIPDKDDAERKLERMLFGDEGGFMGALKSQQERADAMQLTLHSDEESDASGPGENGEDMDEEDMANMADSDVILSPSSNAVIIFCGAKY